MSVGRPPAPEAVVADPARCRDIGAMLARGFSDDPIWRHLVPGDRRWERHAPSVFHHMIRRSVDDRDAWTTESIDGAAVWAPPGHWRTPWTDLVRGAPALVRGFGPGLLKALRTLSLLEAGHPTEPHWYLEFLATEPHLRGKGFGSALITPVLERCDIEGLPAYLESSKEENLAFYGRFGFAVTEELAVGTDAPHCWRMWRDPR